MQADTAKIEAILVDTYVDTDEGGHQSDKSGTLAVLKSGDLKFKTIKLSNMKVYTYGDCGSCKTGYGRRQRHIGLPRQNEITGRSMHLYEVRPAKINAASI